MRFPSYLIMSMLQRLTRQKDSVPTSKHHCSTPPATFLPSDPPFAPHNFTPNTRQQKNNVPTSDHHLSSASATYLPTDSAFARHKHTSNPSQSPSTSTAKLILSRSTWTYSCFACGRRETQIPGISIGNCDTVMEHRTHASDSSSPRYCMMREALKSGPLQWGSGVRKTCALREIAHDD